MNDHVKRSRQISLDQNCTQTLPHLFPGDLKKMVEPDHIGNAARTIHDVETDRGPKKVTNREVSVTFSLIVKIKKTPG